MPRASRALVIGSTFWFAAPLSLRSQTVFDIQAPPSTLRELIERVKTNSGGTVNVLIAPGHEDAFVPALDLRSVSFEGLTELLHAATAETAHPLKFEETSGGWTCRASGPEGDPRFEVKAWAIGDLLDRQTLEDVLALISQAMELLEVTEGAEKPVLKIHEETHTLIGRFTASQARTIDNIIEQLAESGTRKSAEERKAEGRLAIEKRDRAIDELEAHLRSLEEQEIELEQRLLEMDEQADVSEKDRFPYRREIDRIASRVEILKKQLDSLLMERSQLKLKLDFEN